MASYIWDEAKQKMVPSEMYYLEKYMRKAHLQMTVGNQKVTMNFISDNMEPTQHMCDGKYYTSKKKFRETTKAYGCVEIGNDTKRLTERRKPVKLDKRRRRDDIRKAIHDVRDGRAPRIDQLLG